MKKLLILPMLLVLLLCLVGCSSTIETKGNNHNISNGTLDTFTYEGCEYITIGFGNERVIAHKGNCTACVKRSQVGKNPGVQ